MKTELKQMIEKETDIRVLKAIHRFLEDSKMDSTLKEKLIIRALQSEEDIRSNRVLDKEEVIQRTTR